MMSMNRFGSAGLPAAVVLMMGGIMARAAAEAPRWAAPELVKAISVRAGRTDQVLAMDAMLADLSHADVVFLGEQHDDETTHRLELAVYNGLLQRRSGKVVLALEMFERDVQADLDKYLAGEESEDEFLAHARPWGNYVTAYRPLIERARQDRAPVRASNFPRPLLMRLRMSSRGAKAAFAELQKRFPEQVPKRLFPNTPAYWRRVDNAVRGHLAMMRQTAGDGQRLYATQSLWDNTMGETCADALERFPNHLVLHVNGGFHSAYWDGTACQLKRRKPHAVIKTVAIVPTADPAVAAQTGKPVADYVVYVEARATGPNEGYHGVYTQRELKYKLHLPRQKTKPDGKLPLLIWLSDDGFVPDDGLKLWQQRLGRDAVLAVVAAPYQETQADFGVGGRWYWPEDFTTDVGGLVGGVERIWAYVLRHYPVDPDRVCIAGEGTGATVVAAVAVLTDRIKLRAVAVGPRRYAKLKDFPLLLPELMGRDALPRRELTVLAARDAKSWWAPELTQYDHVGIANRFEVRTGDPWTVERQEENLIREALALPRHAAPSGNQRAYLLVARGMPRARYWARLQAIRAESAGFGPVALLEKPPAAGGKAKRLEIKLDPRSLSAPGVLPRCPGPFGGTTVLVLPSDLPQTRVSAWLALEKNDPLAKTSRFHRVRIATGKGARKLPALLETLHSERRNNVLIVPAVFSASADRMRQLHRQVERQADQMTLHWLPGLGACAVPFGGEGGV